MGICCFFCGNDSLQLYIRKIPFFEESNLCIILCRQCLQKEFHLRPPFLPFWYPKKILNGGSPYYVKEDMSPGQENVYREWEDRRID